ncbi:MAG: TOBE domain-containing protein, partial [Coriobacteriia bacterium]|nr:TOBE domain-containing protein [Coriobacteriia bacterium]
YAIRPENIEVTNDTSLFDFSALIKSMEFKGALTRIYSALPDMTEICFDVASEKANELSLSENGTVFLKMPQESQITYPSMTG